MSIEKDKVPFLLMSKIWKNIKYEFSLLGDVSKIILKVLFYILIFSTIYYIFLPIVKYHLPNDLSLEQYENISGFVIIGIIFLSLIISRFLVRNFKNKQ